MNLSCKPGRKPHANKEVPTCICLQSWPRAGRLMHRYVMGHLSDTLIAVCSTSSPFMGLLAAALVKLRLTAKTDRAKHIQRPSTLCSSYQLKDSQDAHFWSRSDLQAVTACAVGLVRPSGHSVDVPVAKQTSVTATEK